MTSLQTSILQTLTYFDLVDYPLTSFEVWKWLWSNEAKKASLAEVEQTLATLQSVEHQDGFWFLNGRKEIIETRHARHRASIRKLHLASRFARLASFVPWVEGVAVVNTLGYRNATTQSDIDFFIITRPGAIWRTRALLGVMAVIMGKRPTREHSQDALCLSFYTTSQALDLRSLKKIGGDPYLTYWLTQVTPLFARGNIWQKFWNDNGWVKQNLPNVLPVVAWSSWICATRAKAASKPARHFQRLEQWAKNLEWRRFPAAIQTEARKGDTNVVVTDSMLKFHVGDRRQEFRERWAARCLELGVPLHFAR